MPPFFRAASGVIGVKESAGDIVPKMDPWHKGVGEGFESLWRYRSVSLGWKCLPFDSLVLMNGVAYPGSTHDSGDVGCSLRVRCSCNTCP